MTTVSEPQRTQYGAAAERGELALLSLSGATILCVLLASLTTLLA